MPMWKLGLTTAEWIAGGMMLAATALNFSNIVGRYLFSSPIAVAEEWLQYMNIWMVIVANVVVVERNAHLRFDFLWTRASPFLNKLRAVLLLALAIGLNGFVLFESIKTILLLYAVQQRSISSGIPLYLVNLALPIGFGGSLIFLLRELWLLIRVDAERTAAPNSGGSGN